MISRRGFIGALAGLIAAPSLIEKIAPTLLHSRKVWTGDFRISQEVLDKCTLDGRVGKRSAFEEQAERTLAEIERHRLFTNGHQWHVGSEFDREFFGGANGPYEGQYFS